MTPSTYSFFQGGGNMGELFRSTSWTSTALGTPDTWPDSLKTAVSISLNSGFPIAIYWGTDFTILYNDAYAPIAGNKNPWALGKPGAIAWAEIWDVLDEQFKSVLANGKSIRSPDTLLLMNRYGYTEECYFDYTLSPIIGIDGSVGGVFNAVIETTYKVINERRNRILQNLLKYLNAAHTLEYGIETSMQVFKQSPEDIPFCLLYIALADEEPILTAHTSQAVANSVNNKFPWEQTLTNEQPVFIENLDYYFNQPIPSIYEQPCRQGLIVPIGKGTARVSGYIVFGISPRKQLDDDYQHFLQAAGLHAGTILNNSFAYEGEQKANRRIVDSENRFRSLVQQAPVAIALFSGKELVIQMANQQILKLWGKNQSVIGKPLTIALPELQGQPILELLHDAFLSGETYYGNEDQSQIENNGKLTLGYYNFVYQPIKNDDGVVTGVMMVATEVTDQVVARQNEQALNEELLATNEDLNQSQLNLEKMNQDLKHSEKLLDEVLNQMPAPIVVLRGPNQIIDLANQSILKFWNKTHAQVKGKPMLQMFPELSAQPFPNQWKHVLETGETIINREKPVKFIIDGCERISFVDYYYQAMTDVNGERTSVLATVLDVTDKVEARERIQASEAEQQALNEELSVINEEMASANEELITINEELTETQANLKETLQQLTESVAEQVKARRQSENSEQRLKNMVMTTPIGMTVLRGRQLIVDIANQQILDIWNRTEQEAVGYPLMELFPELADQPFPKLLDQVFDTGKSIAFSEIEVVISTTGGAKHVYVDFSYDPLFDTDGCVEAIMATVINITEIVHARKRLEQSEAEQQVLNEELSAINEEMVASNEELRTTNEELAEAQDNLSKIIDDLAKSESRFRYVVQQAPVAICILTGRQLFIESVNDMMLKLLGKPANITGKTFAHALPELTSQPILNQLDKVYTSGQPYYSTEAKAMIDHNGELREGYFNSVYQPLKDEAGAVTTIIIVATEVTEQVTARKELQRAEELTRFSVEAANVGTWFMDITTHSAVLSSRLKELFGFYATDEVDYDLLTAQIPELYRLKIQQAVDESMKYGNNYVMEHPVIGYHDQKTRWLRAMGRMYPDPEGRLSQFSGMVIDITEQKMDEIRKNDFIGMVSHELKTPLTSLSAYVQMLLSKAKKSEDSFTMGALDKAYQQVKKMSTMINGFLNVSRLESGKILIEKQDFNLNELVATIIEETRLTSSNYNINYLPVETIIVNADQEKTGSVISNLLSNAVKYSPKGLNINVSCTITGNMAQVSVQDEGMGIKPQDIDKLFDRYYRVESNHTRHISGFGIGLYLSAEIIKQHGGSIWAESQSGKGSTFFFTLPLA